MATMYCVLCKKKHSAYAWRTSESMEGWFCNEHFTPEKDPEYIPERIKEDRKKFAKATLQPYRGGVASSEYIQAYGTKNFSEEDVRTARPVWKEILPQGWERSK